MIDLVTRSGKHRVVQTESGVLVQNHYGDHTTTQLERNPEMLIELCTELEELRAAQKEEPSRLRAVIHHMALMLSDFGRHEPECVCMGDEVPHATDCKDCECGLAEAVAFGVEQSGLPLEPEEPSAEESQRLHAIGVAIVEGLLSRATQPPAPPPQKEPAEPPLPLGHAFEGNPREPSYHCEHYSGCCCGQPAEAHERKEP